MIRTRHPEQIVTMAQVHGSIGRRLGELETRPATVIAATVDAGGQAWNSGNAAWIDPAGCPEWSELRVSNTAGGVSELYRCMSDGTNVQWVRVA